jgi:hypothetical protein
MYLLSLLYLLYLLYLLHLLHVLFLLYASLTLLLHCCYDVVRSTLTSK